MKPVSIIVVVAQNNAIGKNNQLLAYVPGDLKRFKEITTGHKVIMGRNTYFSLPKRPLPNRENIVITDKKDEKFQGCTMAYSIEDALALCDDEKENFIIGGASIYKQFLPYTSKLYLTKVYKNFEADVFFPEIDYSRWEMVETIEMPPSEKNDFHFAYETYLRK